MKHIDVVIDTLAARIRELEQWQADVGPALAELEKIRQEAVDLREALAGEVESQEQQRLLPAVTACLCRLRGERDSAHASACTETEGARRIDYVG